MSSSSAFPTASAPAPAVSIIIPVLDRLEFTKQCLDRLHRHTSIDVRYEVIIVDNGSSDGTEAWCDEAARARLWLRYHRNPTNEGFARANNRGASLAVGRHLLFLNNDTLVQPGWLSEMLRLANADASIGIVGIKQLFPYTNLIYHTGIVFAEGGVPQHLYPHLDASLPAVNQEREYQAVNGACLLVERSLFAECGGFDDAYVNGYEDVDLCMRVRERGRKVVCCTGAFIYHYGQISEGRTASDHENAALFARRWQARIKVDQGEYLLRDQHLVSRPPASAAVRSLADDCVYLADDLGQASALTWVNVELASALLDLGAPVFVRADRISPTVDPLVRQRLKTVALAEPPIGGTQVKWSHYRPQHLGLELSGTLDLEFFVINYLFAETSREPWDAWLQSVRQSGRYKLPLSPFCESVLRQVGVAADQCAVVQPGYSREVREVETAARHDGTFRFLTVTNSHDLERYNTDAVIEAFSLAFDSGDDVALVVKDYGASSGNTTLRRTLAQRRGGPRIEYVPAFTDKRTLIELYKSCDAFVSGHRGEGFGMKILDAMACGLPVITPLFGGPTAYCTPDNCFPVEFALVPMGDCLDTREWAITNQPRWAEVDRRNLGARLRRVHDDRAVALAQAARGQRDVLESFSWEHTARQLLGAAVMFRESRPKARRRAPASPGSYRSPYWLGLRVSVVIPTRNRKVKLLTCLEALGRQSILPQEFEVIVVDDGSTDGTAEALQARAFPFAVRCFRQEGAGPGAARNLGVAHAAGELVLFIGDDIYAGERLLEEHLVAHASHPAPGAAILGHIDWPDAFTPNAVMEYVCGDAMLQFGYSYIVTAPSLDHRFFYTSNVSLKRQFLVEAADAGITFDSSFHRAAFEDSEFAFRLLPRGLSLRYAANARATHDHWMDLTSFAERERAAGQMAVVFYRKHPGQDDQLLVGWMSELVRPASRLLGEPDLLRQVEMLDAQTDALLKVLAASLEQLLAINRRPGANIGHSLSADRVRPALHNVFRTVFDVERTRGKLEEWFATVEDQDLVRAAQALAGVTRKIEFLTAQAHGLGAAHMTGRVDLQAAGHIASAQGTAPKGAGGRGAALRRLVLSPAMATRLVNLDRSIDARLQATGREGWLEAYRALRGKVRRLLT